MPDPPPVLTPREQATLAVDLAHRKWWVQIGLLIGDVALIALILWLSNVIFPGWWHKPFDPLINDVQSLPSTLDSAIPKPGEFITYLIKTTPRPGWVDVIKYVVPTQNELFPQTTKALREWSEKANSWYESASSWFNTTTRQVRMWVAKNWLFGEYIQEQDLLLPTTLVKYLPPTVAPVEEWTGPPLRELPEEVVIPNIWETIAKAVEDEGGTTEEAALLYATQDSECDDPNGDCLSSAGAEGWFQFLPTTWPAYAEDEWSAYDLYESARAAYRMHLDLGLFNQTNKQDYQDRFSGQDDGFAWNGGDPDSSVYDGYDQGGDVWDQAQEIIAAAEDNLVEPDDKSDETAVDNEKKPEEKSKKPELCYPVSDGVTLAFEFGDSMWYGTHQGIDWNLLEDGEYQSIEAFALLDGEVSNSYDATVDGIINLVPEDDPGVVIKYFHMDETDPPKEGKVKCGDTLGIADGGGTVSQGPHLHLEVWDNGVRIDPLDFFTRYTDPSE